MVSVVSVCLDIVGTKVQEGTPVRLTKAWNTHFWMLFENMFCGASARTPQGTALRVLSATWWIAIVVLMNAFAGQMRACLMVKTELQKVNTVSDIAARPYLKVHLLKGTVLTRYFESSSNAAERTVWRMIRRDGTDAYGLFRYSDEMLTEIAKERAVVLHGSLVLQFQASNFCKRTTAGEFYFGTQHMNNWMVVAYMNRNMDSHLRYSIEKTVVILRESGIAEHVQVTTMPSLDPCVGIEEDQGLKLGDLASILYLYAALCALSVAVFVAELLACWCTSLRNTR
ncbi:putative glutamate receptor [Haemaphysalis longicornis]